MFSIKRGRPKKELLTKDKGTDELQDKRRMCLTDEPLDLCERKGLITQDQHWAGVHLRWLYTIKFGSAHVRGVDYGSSYYSSSPKMQNVQWKVDREREYNGAIALLQKHKSKSLVIDVCILDRFPNFLLMVRSGHKISRRAEIKELERFREGLDILLERWLDKQNIKGKNSFKKYA